VLLKISGVIWPNTQVVEDWVEKEDVEIEEYVLYSGARIRKGELANTEFQLWFVNYEDLLLSINIEYILAKVHTISI
jgi:hypothetical protein